MKNTLIMLGYLLFAILIFGLFLSVDLYRWQAFQEVTNSEVSYFKWRFISSGR